MLENWSKNKEIHKRLKAKTSGEGRQVVFGVGNDNGWETWRRLAQHFEPNNAVRRGQVLSELGGLNHKRCKNPQETLVVLFDIERQVQEIREITGKPPGDEWLVSILFTVMDKDTRTNVSSTVTTGATLPHLRDKVRTYATLMGGSPGEGAAPMDKN